MIKVAIIIGSTRPERVGEAVAVWVYEQAIKGGAAEFELVDIADYNLPLLDEPVPPSQNKYTQEHTKVWAAKIAQFDAFIFVTPEYNHGMPAALKNALDFLYKEWNNKSAGFVSYGGMSGARSVEQLRPVMSALKIADVQAQLMFSLRTDFVGGKEFKPEAYHEKELNNMIKQVVEWGTALKPLRG